MEKKQYKSKIALTLSIVFGFSLCSVTHVALTRAGVLDFLKARVKHSQFKKRLEAQQLIEPNEAVHGFSPDAFVLLGSIHPKSKQYAFRSPAIGFVVGDGSLILTAAHCVEAHQTNGKNQVPLEQYVISPYYGDLFSYDVVAIDHDSDLAILKPTWKTHPALRLGTAQDLKDASEVYVCGKRMYDTDLLAQKEASLLIRPDWFFRVRMEELAIWKGARGSEASNEILLKSARYVLPGWSGSAFICSDGGSVVGLLTRHDERKAYGVTTSHLAMGCSIHSVQTLLEQSNVELAARANPPSHEPIAEAKTCLALLLEKYKGKDTLNPNKIQEQLQQFCALRPNSVVGQRLLGYLAEDPNTNRRRIIREQAFLRAMHIDPTDAHSFAAYGLFLRNRGDYDQALKQIHKALSLDPNDMLALENLCKMPNHVSADERLAAAYKLIGYDPNSPLFHHNVSDALYQLSRYPEAFNSGLQAHQLDPNGPYQRALGNACAKLGRLDEAQEHLRSMTDICSCSTCWTVYTNFLIEYRGDDPNALTLAEQGIQKTKAPRHTLQVKLKLARLKLLKQESLPKAIGHVKTLIEQDPNCGYYWWAKADLHRSDEQYSDAVRAAQKAVDLDPNGPFVPRLANCLAKDGQILQARQTYNQMLEAYPDRARYWFWYADFLIDHTPDYVRDIEDALDRAADPNLAWPVDPNELSELTGSFRGQL
jgi:tetratricopeptide (TPR) repeat protein